MSGVRKSPIPVLTAAFVGSLVTSLATAMDTSSPAMLQLFEARWETIEERLPDIRAAGYGSLWLPPPGRGDSGGFSVGYDVFDRFDLGQPRYETLYGSEDSLKSLTTAAHRATTRVYVDFIANHNGFGNRTDPDFVALGGYPGFALTLPTDINGDFNDPFINFDNDPFRGQLAGLNDIAHEKNYTFIRQPVAVEEPANLPGGTVYNRPNPANARFYPDRDLPGWNVFDPERGRNLTLYDYNSATPLAGDAVPETALDLLARNARWLIQTIGVDGFRIDAAKHFDEGVLDTLDAAVFRAHPRPQHDGSIQPVFIFSEVLDGSKTYVNQFTRRDLANNKAIDPADTTVRGNRDALDFPLFFALRSELTGQSSNNNWHGIRHASIDDADDGLQNGSQGVAFVDSHDDQSGTPFLKNVAYAYTLMRPGEALVYFNAREFGNGRDFPEDGKVDALGGVFGETITRLVQIRNSHGRGNFHERWIDEAFGDTNGNGQQESSIYVYEREKSAIVGLSNRTDDNVETRHGVPTGFEPGAILVELTGNAADSAVDPGDAIPNTVKVDGAGRINLSIPGNATHGRGYVIYGPPGPVGTLSLSNVETPLPGATPSAATNGTARLTDIAVVRGDTFDVRLETTPVSIIDPELGLTVRDVDADGDSALLRIDAGLDLNNQPGIDHRTPGTVAYGFEAFTGTNRPGYIDDQGVNVGTGAGTFVQTIDAAALGEGRHFLTVRAFRHRDDGGPAVFTDFEQTVYVDRLRPLAAVVSFEPFAAAPAETSNRDLIVRSLDQTADNMHIFLDLPAALSDEEVLGLALSGQNDAGRYGADAWVSGFRDITTGNHVATVVTFEPTFDGTHGYNVQRFAGMFTATDTGSGFGDLNANGLIDAVDLLGPGNGSFEELLYSEDTKFNAAADVDGNGRINNLDLFALESVVASADASAIAAYDAVRLGRGDINGDGIVDGQDAAAIYARFGTTEWLPDLNADGVVSIDDVTTLITIVVRSTPGDFDLDGHVDGDDFLIWQQGFGVAAGMSYEGGDADLDGDVDGEDFLIWQAALGFTDGRGGIQTATLPEATSLALLASCGLAAFPCLRSHCRAVVLPGQLDVTRPLGKPEEI